MPPPALRMRRGRRLTLAFASTARRGRNLYLLRTLASQALLGTAVGCSLASTKFQASGEAPFPAAGLRGPTHCHGVLGVGVKESGTFVLV